MREIAEIRNAVHQIWVSEPPTITDAATVFVAGSLIERLGNSGSDVDVYVVLPADAVIPTPCVENRDWDGHRVDFHYVGWGELIQVAEHVERLGDALAYQNAMREVAHRIRVGVPVVNDACFAELQAMFRFDLLAEQLFRRSVTLLDWTLDDVWGMVDAGDLDVAALAARNAVVHAASAYLLSKGETNSKQKWVGKLLARLPQTEVNAKVTSNFWRLNFPSFSSREPRWLREHIDDCVRYSHWVIDLAQG